MRVCIDGIVFENSYQRGIQRYFRGVVEHLPEGLDVDIVLGERARAALPARAHASILPGVLRALPRPWRRAAGRTHRRGRELAADVFHSSYYTSPVSSAPAVLTVQDMIVERFPDYFHNRWADEEVRRKRTSIEAAAVLITGSHDTAADVKAFFPRFADRVVVIHHGVDHISAAEHPRESPARSQGDGGPYALFVGDRGGYKNFRCVLEAIGRTSWPEDTALVVIGPEPRENERALIARFAASERVRFAGRVDDASLRAHYAGAIATIVPSLAEGFGFPVLEAQRTGCPVVCSDIGVFREIAGDAALFFDPVRPDQLGMALAKALDSRVASRLSAAGLANSATYTWARCAQQTAEAYQRAVAVRSQ